MLTSKLQYYNRYITFVYYVLLQSSSYEFISKFLTEHRSWSPEHGVIDLTVSLCSRGWHFGPISLKFSTHFFCEANSLDKFVGQENTIIFYARNLKGLSQNIWLLGLLEVVWEKFTHYLLISERKFYGNVKLICNILFVWLYNYKIFISEIWSLLFQISRFEPNLLQVGHVLNLQAERFCLIHVIKLRAIFCIYNLQFTSLFNENVKSKKLSQITEPLLSVQ